MKDDGAREVGERSRCLLLGVSGVDHDCLPELGRELELAREEIALALARRVVAEEVEAGLADRDRALVGEQSAQFVEPLGVVVGRLVRVDAEGRPDAVAVPRDLERRPAGVEP